MTKTGWRTNEVAEILEIYETYILCDCALKSYRDRNVRDKYANFAE